MADRAEQWSKAALLSEAWSGVTPAEAMGKLSDGGRNAAASLILAYTPSACAFARWVGKNFAKLGGDMMGDVYEFRCFGADFELRWVKDGAGETGRAVVLKEAAETEEAAKAYHVLDGQYLLWGTKRRSGAEYDELYEYRVGSLKVPRVDGLRENGRAVLKYREYFGEDKYGNLFFFAERLVELQAYQQNGE